MATSTARKPGAARPVRAVRGTNFEPKKIRKARRKLYVRGVLGNIVVDARMAKEDRQEFYRNLRMIKLRRRHLAKEMRALSNSLYDLMTEVQRTGNRYPDFSASTLHDARQLAKEAYTSASVAADEYQLFSRVRVYYVKGS